MIFLCYLIAMDVGSNPSRVSVQDILTAHFSMTLYVKRNSHMNLTLVLNGISMAEFVFACVLLQQRLLV